ncbi:hypothetical protein ACKI18_46160 [Streptomyces niveiscabiei]|uniref:Uncharacterized protein n=1 Tax=Streptomyces niveiscabiei TaxID=164115 RepID=A0ABW9I9A0_9ACTN
MTVALPTTGASADSDATLRELAAKEGILIGSGATNPTYLDEPKFGEVRAPAFARIAPAWAG